MPSPLNSQSVAEIATANASHTEIWMRLASSRSSIFTSETRVRRFGDLGGPVDLVLVDGTENASIESVTRGDRDLESKAMIVLFRR